MSVWFWSFLLFSFLGYLLEKGYAAITHAVKQNRKCFVLLPLCPVYGVSVTAVLMLPQSLREDIRTLLLVSALVPCVVEYMMHLYYERCFQVCYWDYREAPYQLHGRICLPFALVWTALMPFAVRVIAPRVLPTLAAMPTWLSFGVWMLLAADWLISRYMLLCCHDTERLRLSFLCFPGELAEGTSECGES